ncbi:MAG TPA: hypothetical protein VIQ99_10670 [Gammaproteobacteria bacterium]
MQRARPVDLGCLLLTLAAAVALPAAQAQAPASGGSAGCIPRASRAAPSCEPTQTVIELETKIDITLELPDAKLLQCAAAIEIEYWQRDTVVGVAATVDTKDCAASSGEYTVAVIVRDEELELTTLQFSETWQRLDAQPVTFEKDYPIGADVDLVRVRARPVRCTCAEVPQP